MTCNYLTSVDWQPLLGKKKKKFWASPHFDLMVIPYENLSSQWNHWVCEHFDLFDSNCYQKVMRATQSTAGLLLWQSTVRSSTMKCRDLAISVLPSPSVCLSIGFTNLLCLGEIHTSCLTAHCHVYPGRSVLCNLNLVFNAQRCRYIEGRLQREGETEK